MSTQRLAPDARVPARYIGSYAVRLAHRDINGAVRDDAGKLRNNSLVHRGDIVHLRAHEVYGASYLFDPRGQRDPQFLGVGKVVLPEHAELSDAERSALGYEHHEGRRDFEPVYALDEATRRFGKPDPEETPESSEATAASAAKRGRGAAAATEPESAPTPVVEAQGE